MFVLYNKNKMQNQDNQDKAVQTKHREQKKKNPAGGMDVCLLWVLRVCQVEVSATGWSLVQRSPTDCGASLCVISKPQEWRG
jgi:hypothetical protein